MIKEFLKKYWWRYLIGILFLVTVDIIQLFIPREIGSIVDILNTQSPNLNQVKTLIFGIIMLALGLGIGRVFWRISIIGAARLFEYQTWKNMFDHIIGLDQDFFDKWRTGDLMTRFTSDVSTLMRMLGILVIMLVDTIVLTTLTVFAMGTFVNWRLTFISVLPLPLIAIISLFFGRFIHRRFRELQEKTSELSNITEENVSGVDVVKLYSNYDTMQEIFDNKSQEFYNSYIRLVKVWGLMFPLAMLVGQLATIFVFNFGGPMVINNQITLGDFIMTNQYIGMLIWPMMAVGNLINLIQRGRASLKRVNEVLEQKNSIQEPAREDFEFQGHYQINHLTFKYPGSQREVLKDINMNINPGEMVAFVGRIGSGKSTLAKLLVKLYPVERGQIFLDGKDINDVNGEFIRDYVSYVPQDSFLFSMTIRENIAFANEKMEDKVEEFAKLSHVHDDIMSFENKYDTIVGERGATLSGGQRQRVTIARALAKRSKWIILDDCLSAVDTETEEEIIKTLRQQAEGKTILVISHRLKAVKNADQIYVFDNGQIVESGNHNQLISQEGIYYSMYMKQLIEKNLEE
ncbi:ABC transporter related [Petrotoga mobilis SJ95]|uniref:ABC transporter related n=1 Tax=Petrotoga mobilis (strain DSM 10674 / SJ95) TaxID=403833 RepID=A9BEY8_PETMO|nr:ABC transporter related [Petrotoga mobilis SJ95]